MLKIGIVGLPNVGKSTLFKVLTRKNVDIANYPFCTIDPNIGVVEVPDNRLDMLTKKFNSKRKIPAIIEFVDIAGLVKGASKGQGLGNKFLSHIREVDAIVQVVRGFNDSDIVHIDGEINPSRDLEIINTELILADLDTLEKYSEKIEKELKKQNKELEKEKDILDKLKKVLSHGKLANECNLNEGEKDIIKHLNLLTIKPFLYILNCSDSSIDIPDGLKDRKYIFVDIKTEEDIMNMSKEEISDFGINSALSDLIKSSFDILDLIVFFTTGEDESRSWEIKDGTTAQKAGAVIHTDFEKNFIRAETISWDELLKTNSWSKAKEKGLIRSEGKEYIVKDGDVINFLI